MTAFTVVIPAYNTGAMITKALKSVERQTEQDLTVIVVDDGSSDDTAAQALAFCEPRGWTVVSQENAGPSAARNRALRMADSRWIALIDSDDLWLPHHLKRMRELLEQAPDTALVFPDAWVYEDGTRKFGRQSAGVRHRPRPFPTDSGVLFDSLLNANWVYGATCYPTDLALELGGYAEGARAGEDWELWLRLVASGRPVFGTNERTCVYRRRPGQASGDPELMWAGTIEALRALEARDLPAERKAAVAQRLHELESIEPGVDRARSKLRDFLGWSTRWASPVRDFRLRPPADVVADVGDLL